MKTYKMRAYLEIAIEKNHFRNTSKIFKITTAIFSKGMYCRNFWDCFGSFFLFYIIKSGFFGVNGLPQVHRYGFYSVSAHFDPLRPPLGSLSDPRRHTLLSHGLCFKMHWKKTVHFSNSCQIAIYEVNFKKLGSFDISKVMPVWIRLNS